MFVSHYWVPGWGTKDTKRMGTPQNFKGGFLKALLKDPTANTIVIGAASLVPMIAMVGGAVDASRFYMTETRLQAACDAGALAARRAMSDDNFTSEHRQIGNQFFNQNFPNGTFGSEDRRRRYTSTGDGIVKGTASTTLPTSLMGMFGYEEFEIAVSCEADINISNTDIMFVLDVTGSMACEPSGGNCSSGSNSRIAALRTSVVNFYDTVEDATSNSAQVRYGIVPYSNQVNVGDSLRTEWMAPDHEYNSRRWIETTTDEWVPQDEQPNRTGTLPTSTAGFSYQGNYSRNFYDVDTFNDCVDIFQNYQEWDLDPQYNLQNMNQLSQVTNGNIRTTTYRGNINYQVYYDSTGGTYYTNQDRCFLYFDVYRYDIQGEVVVTEFLEQTITEAYNYASLNYDLTDLYATGQLQAPTGTRGAMETHTWNGCIEEADTVRSTDYDPIPGGANDLLIDLVPNSDSTYWKPQMASLYFLRYDEDGNSTVDEQTHDVDWHYHPNSSTCPKPARKLAKFNNRSELENWLSASNGFVATGNTYHDFGMIWGARFISPDGIFASENNSAPNGDAISRHIVFMTDGELVPNSSVYGLYGVEWWDRRITSDAAYNALFDRHAARFQAACKAARNKNISVWVVAFGTTLTQNLIDCATPGRAYSANDAAALDEAFTEIAEKIAALRLTA